MNRVVFGVRKEMERRFAVVNHGTSIIFLSLTFPFPFLFYLPVPVPRCA